MRYDSESDLPDSVRNQLPPPALAIFRQAYNAAWDNWQEPEDADAIHSSREDAAQLAAWAAVRDRYERDAADTWQPKPTA
jgi:cation transport regulator